MRSLASALLLCLLAAPAAAQQGDPPNAAILVAKPGLVDPNFRETVVLVTQTVDGHTLGVILNRPTGNRIEGHAEPVYAGGPVLPRTLVALFESAEPPRASAFPLLKNIWLSMHPDNVEALKGSPPGRRMRLFAGFSGWSPGQLQSELDRDGWFVLPASESVLFRSDTKGLWEELIEKTREPGRKTLYFFP